MNEKAIVFSLLLSATPLSALTPGALEAFTTQSNADAWTLFSYADNSLYFPGWDDDEGVDPFVADGMTGSGLWYFADSSVGSGAFTGNYSAVNAESVSLDVRIYDPALIGVIDFAIYSEVSGGGRYLFSAPYFGSDFDEPGWFLLEFPFDQPWFYFDEGLNDFVEVMLSPADLSDISEIGVRVFPVEGNTTPTGVGIDNVAINHAFVLPELDISASGSVVTLAFDTEPAHEYAIERYDVQDGLWEDVPGQTGIVFPAPYSEQFPAIGSGLFRCRAERLYSIIGPPPG